MERAAENSLVQLRLRELPPPSPTVLSLQNFLKEHTHLCGVSAVEPQDGEVAILARTNGLRAGLSGRTYRILCRLKGDRWEFTVVGNQERKRLTSATKRRDRARRLHGK